MYKCHYPKVPKIGKWNDKHIQLISRTVLSQAWMLKFCFHCDANGVAYCITNLFDEMEMLKGLLMEETKFPNNYNFIE